MLVRETPEPEQSERQPKILQGNDSRVQSTQTRRFFRQDDPGDLLFYLRRGKVKLSVARRVAR